METQRNGKPCASIDRQHLLPHWDRINWSRCEKEVRKLQMRIAKAQREGKKGRVKALQRILTRSLAAKILAVRRVTTNRGKNTPGVDRETWKTPEKKIVATLNLKRKKYRPLPLRRVYIPKNIVDGEI